MQEHESNAAQVNPYASPTTTSNDARYETPEALPPELIARATTLTAMGLAMIWGAAICFPATPVLREIDVLLRREGFPPLLLPCCALLVAVQIPLAFGLFLRREWARRTHVGLSVVLVLWGTFWLATSAGDAPLFALLGVFFVAYHAALLRLMRSPRTREVCRRSPRRITLGHSRLVFLATAFKTIVLAALWSGSLWLMGFSLLTFAGG